MRHAHFAFSPDYTPVNHGSYGTHPISVRAAHLALRAEVEAAPDPFIAFDFHDRLAKERAATANMLNCPLDELVFVPNATTGTDTVLKNMIWETGDVVLCYEVVYGSVALGLRYLAETRAVEVEIVPVAFPLSDDDLVDTMRKAAREINTKAGKRVRLAIIDTIVSGPGMRVPFERLIPALRAEGALVAVDGAHGIGQIEIDLDELQPDFFVTNLHKWLFVPRGCAAFYVPKKHQHLIRTTLPTSHGFRPLVPVPGEHRGTWTEMFDFTGTLLAPNVVVQAIAKWFLYMIRNV
jgi:selenocysteine lyase/cysteine desulfurase